MADYNYNHYNKNNTGMKFEQIQLLITDKQICHSVKITNSSNNIICHEIQYQTINETIKWLITITQQLSNQSKN